MVEKLMLSKNMSFIFAGKCVMFIRVVEARGWFLYAFNRNFRVLFS
jgi:hypothetical protein